MNLNLIQRNTAATDSELVQKLSEAMKLHPVLTELLISRGINTEQAVRRYLYPDPADFYDPFLLKGMREAVDRIETAVKNDERVVVYGDYDADGVCASAILALYLASRGLTVFTHIPNRLGEGYGLNVQSIERIIENACPDLIITCDCGISGHDEVELAMDLGVDVIVTDHHEISDSIPECIVINPKQTDCDYPYAYLCGAGVALKVVHALGGYEAAEQYLDLAAVATVADLVPLLDENRLIVQLGLKAMSQKKNLGLRLMFEDQKLTYPATSGDIAYKIAPRINAAGRMGDAYRAFELLTLSDVKRVAEILADINADNNKRKTLCDKLYEEAVADLRYEDLAGERAIILSNPEWEKGITGILAARLAGDFKRPAFVMVSSGDGYKGTSRSIAGINIYELLGSVSDLLIEYGGHSQAAGFSILEGNIPAFKQRVNEYLQRFDLSLFEPNQEYDLAIDADELNSELASALECIEPCGNSNSKPLFLTKFDRLTVVPCKSNYQHTNVTAKNGLQIMAFNYYSQNQFLLGDSDKHVVVELQLSSYGGRNSAKGILRGAAPEKLYVNEETAKANFLKTLAFVSSCPDEPIMTEYEPSELSDIGGNDIYGTLYIAGCKQTYERFADSKQFSVLHEFLYATSKNNYTRIIVSPEPDENLLLENYRKVIFLDTPPGSGWVRYVNKRSKAKVFVPKTSNESYFYSGLTVGRAEFGKYFDVMRRNESLSSANILSYFKQLKSRVSDIQLDMFVAAVMVFSQLKLITVSRGTFLITVNRGVTTDLNDSSIYRYLSEHAAQDKKS